MTRDARGLDESRIVYSEYPSLDNPVMIAAWPGMGLVGLKVVTYLKEALELKELARLEAPDCFRLAGVPVKDGIIHPPLFPANTFYYLKSDREGGPDLIVFIGEDQPSTGKEFPVAWLVTDVALRMGVAAIYTAAAMVTSITHKEDSRVWICSTSTETLEEALEADGGVETVKLEEGTIGGLNGILLGIARMRGLQGTCLLGEIPYYATNIENPKASAAILRWLGRRLGIDLELQPLQEKARYIEEQIESAVQTARTLARMNTDSPSGEEEDEGDKEVIN